VPVKNCINLSQFTFFFLQKAWLILQYAVFFNTFILNSIYNDVEVVSYLSAVDLWTKKPLQKVGIARKWKDFAFDFSSKSLKNYCKKRILQENRVHNKQGTTVARLKHLG
jgi:hypothetical protein